MADSRLSRVLARLHNLPSISLPTDYLRPTDALRVVEAEHLAELSEQAALGLLKIALFSEGETDGGDEGDATVDRPSAFHLILAAFAVLLHRYTADTDLIIATSSSSARDPLLLRLSI